MVASPPRPPPPARPRTRLRARRGHADPGRGYGRSPLVEAELTVSSQRVCSGIMSLYVLETAGSGA